MNKNLKRLLLAEGFDENRIEQISETFTALVNEAAKIEIDKIQEACDNTVNELKTDIDNKLDETMSDWLEENKLQLDNAIVVEQAQELIKTLSDISGGLPFLASDDLTETKVSLDEMTDKYDKEQKRNYALSSSIGLTNEQQDTLLETVSENIDGDFDTFKESINETVGEFNSTDSKKLAIMLTVKHMTEAQTEKLLEDVAEFKDLPYNDFVVELDKASQTLAVKSKAKTDSIDLDLGEGNLEDSEFTKVQENTGPNAKYANFIARNNI